MSIPPNDPQPSERDPRHLSGTDPLNPAEPGPTQNSGAGLSPEPQKPASPYSYQAAQPSGYAYPSAASMPTSARPPLPREVNLAFWLIIAAGVLNFISTLLGGGAASGTPASLQGAAIGIAIVVGLVTTGIYVLLAIFIRKGHNWARITATVLAAISLLLLIMSWVTLAALQGNPEVQQQLGGQSLQPGGLEITLNILITLLGVAGVVLCWLKPSNPYFKPQQLTY
ncbi:hypothetical protein GC088_12155 [Arthrobacter sp. JZ12]|uniref:hypothetical protein n=1 Tax=Arthrobacter sp. JZ12 TaxID=2654190 RepID=UPI002B4695B0|nr:hypothetical protein [Arthrobacter sp. JZ12]WRH25748.1 hypothetical protein GC088_12155 [Arthrobacter sp. JZ12]